MHARTHRRTGQKTVRLQPHYDGRRHKKYLWNLTKYSINAAYSPHTSLYLLITDKHTVTAQLSTRATATKSVADVIPPATHTTTHATKTFILYHTLHSHRKTLSNISHITISETVTVHNFTHSGGYRLSSTINQQTAKISQ